MGSLLASHLEQIGSCSRSIAELPFSGPKKFTNAILANHDITALIRDTEAHERALFHLAPPVVSDITADSHGIAPISTAALKSRRMTVAPVRKPRSKAVAAVLGGELYAQIHDQTGSRQAGEVDVELLLEGAQKLANVYPIAGASEKIAQLKRRHGHLQANIAHYEERVAQQGIELERMRNTTAEPDLRRDTVDTLSASTGTVDFDTNAVQEEIRELERKKKGLEDRVVGMERDLGGLLR